MSDKMTIAQALRRIKKMKGQIAEHHQRAVSGVSYEKDKIPAFRFQTEVDAMLALQQELVALESRVAYANANGTIVLADQEISLSLVIRQLQELKGRIAFLKGLNLRNETVKNRETEWDDNEMKQITRVSETTYVSDLGEKERDTQVKLLQDQFEQLNNLLEDANHTTQV